MKKIITAIAVILIAAAAVLFFVSQKTEDTPVEKGTIETVSNDPAENNVIVREYDETDEELYRELSAYEYSGKVNYRNYTFRFLPCEDDGTAKRSKYECHIYDNDHDDMIGIYNVYLTKDELRLEYLMGTIEATFECEYSGGNLTINEVLLDKETI